MEKVKVIKTLKPYSQVIEELPHYSEYASIVNPMIENFGKKIEVYSLNNNHCIDNNGYAYHNEWFELS